MTAGQGRCGKRFGRRREMSCQRLDGHGGWHAVRLTVEEVEFLAGNRREQP